MVKVSRIPLYVGISLIAVLSYVTLEILQKGSLSDGDRLNTIAAFIGVIGGFVGLYYLEIKTSESQWKREQTFKEIKKIYEPMYDNLLNIIGQLQYDHFNVQVYGYQVLGNEAHNVNGRLLERKDPNLYTKITVLDNKLELYNKQLERTLSQVNEIAKREVEKRYFVKIEWPNENEYNSQINQATHNINYNKVFNALLLGFTFKQFCEQRKTPLESAYKQISEELNRNKVPINFTPDIYDSLFLQIGRDELVREIRRDLIDLRNESQVLKDNLELRILEPT